MVGGVAVAAGTGVLPTPFTREHPGPAASVSAVRTPDRPLDSPSPSPGITGGTGTVVPTPDGPSGDPSDGSSSNAVPGADESTDRPGPDSTGSSDRTREWWARTRAYCRDVLDGKDLDADRRRALEHVAGGGARVRLYCSGVLGRQLGGSDDGRDSGEGDGGEKGSGGEDSGQGDQGDQGGGDGDGDGHHIGPRANDPRGNGGITLPTSLNPRLTALLPVRPMSSASATTRVHRVRRLARSTAPSREPPFVQALIAPSPSLPSRRPAVVRRLRGRRTAVPSFAACRAVSSPARSGVPPVPPPSCGRSSSGVPSAPLLACCRAVSSPTSALS